jgi:phospholipid/cholesterol/gamma-HCH transport system permease protein
MPMPDAGTTLEWETTAQGTVLRPAGSWRAEHLPRVEALLRQLEAKAQKPITIDGSGVAVMDTSGIYALSRIASECGNPTIRDALSGFSESQIQLFELVWGHMDRCSPVSIKGQPSLVAILARLGMGLERAFFDAIDHLAFLGQTLVALTKSLLKPQTIRWASTFHVMEHAGVNALPIVMILSFFVGAVVAYLGANLLQQFGAEVFAVELVAFAVLREFGIIITAILIAGRSDSAFTAQIGSMRMQQEIDAMQVMGLDIFRALVIPRVIACLIMLPLLAFAAMMAGILGGMLVLWASLDIAPSFFLSRMVDQVSINQFWAGIAKAPVFALVIAIIGCRQGMKVENNVESLGANVTSSVVQSIFAVIVLDALFAMAYLELGI